MNAMSIVHLKEFRRGAYSIVFERKPLPSSMCVLTPVAVFFPRGSDGPYIDLTFGWLWFGMTFRKY